MEKYNSSDGSQIKRPSKWDLLQESAWEEKKLKQQLNRDKTSEEKEIKKMTSAEYFEEFEQNMSQLKIEDERTLAHARYKLKMAEEIKSRAIKLLSENKLEEAKQLLETMKRYELSQDEANIMHLYDKNLKSFLERYGLEIDDFSVFKYNVEEIEKKIENAWKVKMWNLTQE